MTNAAHLERTLPFLPVRKSHTPLTPCRITLLVLAILALTAALGVGVAGMTQAIPMKRIIAICLLAVAPFFLIAVGAMLITGISVTLHNKEVKSSIEKLRKGITESDIFSAFGDQIVTDENYHEAEVYQFALTNANVDSVCDEIIGQIDACTRQSKFLTLYSKGRISYGMGQIDVFLRVN